MAAWPPRARRPESVWAVRRSLTRSGADVRRQPAGVSFSGAGGFARAPLTSARRSRVVADACSEPDTNPGGHARALTTAPPGGFTLLVNPKARTRATAKSREPFRRL